MHTPFLPSLAGEVRMQSMGDGGKATNSLIYRSYFNPLPPRCARGLPPFHWRKKKERQTPNFIFSSPLRKQGPIRTHNKDHRKNPAPIVHATISVCVKHKEYGTTTFLPSLAGEVRMRSMGDGGKAIYSQPIAGLPYFPPQLYMPSQRQIHSLI